MAAKRDAVGTDTADRTETCLDCGLPFVVAAAEQVWYRDHARPEPERCPVCRERRRAERNAPLLAAHQAEESSAAERGVTVYGGPGQRSNSAPPSRQLYPAICHSCGKETEVPFIPRGNRPVYCRDCFTQRRGRR
jgi:CxxC-x17-CxxC domain-containing protein